MQFIKQALLLVCIASLTGCAGSIGKPAKFMQQAALVPDSPPAGKALVRIHRPKSHGGRYVKTGVWDGTDWVGALGSGHSTAYPCDPGQHYFVGRSSEMIGVVEAQLLADKTYDLWVDSRGQFPDLRLKPVLPGSKQWELVPTWTKANLWVARDTTATGYEELKREALTKLLEDFVNGPKKDRVEHLGSGDHR